MDRYDEIAMRIADTCGAYSTEQLTKISVILREAFPTTKHDAAYSRFLLEPHGTEYILYQFVNGEYIAIRETIDGKNWKDIGNGR